MWNLYTFFDLDDWPGKLQVCHEDGTNSIVAEEKRIGEGGSDKRSQKISCKFKTRGIFKEQSGRGRRTPSLKICTVLFMCVEFLLPVR